jgi:hypothetical protein
MRYRVARNPRSASTSRGRAAVLWALAAFVCGQLALTITLERWRPDLCDPEYGWRLDRLQAGVAAGPERPLVVVLGSSRVGCGLRPEALPSCHTPNGETPLVYNMSLTSSGPVMDLLCLRRLLAQGIRPQYLVVEVLSPCLKGDGRALESGELCLPAYRLRWGDLPQLKKYTPRRWIPYGKWLEQQGAPWFSNRFCLLSHYLPNWVPSETRRRETFWENNLDRYGWVQNPLVTVTQEQYRAGVKVAHGAYGAPFDSSFRVSPIVDKAMHDLLEICKRERISAALLLMPEGTDFRRWYSPEARFYIDTYLDNLSKEYGIPLVDASRWLPDDCFSDSHHLLPEGADKFTERLGREFLEPMLAGKLAPGRSAQLAGDIPEPR